MAKKQRIPHDKKKACTFTLLSSGIAYADFKASTGTTKGHLIDHGIKISAFVDDTKDWQTKFLEWAKLNDREDEAQIFLTNVAALRKES